MPLVRFPNCGQAGLNRDLSQHELSQIAWTDARNIRFLDGMMYQFLGHGEVYNAPIYEPQYVMPCYVGSGRYWIYATPTKQFAVTIADGEAVHTDITHVTARTGIVNQWTGTLLSGVPILNSGNETDLPMAWDLNTSHKFVNLQNWPSNTYCKSLRAFKNILIALNITKGSARYPYMVKWSHPAEPGNLPITWNEADANYLAGEFDIAEGGPIIDGMSLRDSFMVYKENGCYRLDYIGGTFVLRPSKVLGMSGALNRNCIADIDGFHVVLTTNDVIIHDGNQANSVLDKQSRRWLFQNIDVDNVDKCFVFTNPFFNEVFICFPGQGSSSCDQAIVYNYRDKTVSVRDLPNINHAQFGPVDNGLTGNWEQDSAPWSSDLSLWNSPDFVPSAARVIAASSETKLYMIDSSASFDGELPDSMAERRGLSFGMPERMKLVKRVRPRISGNVGETVNFYVGRQADPYEDPTYSGPFAFTIGRSTDIWPFVSGKYIALKVATGTAYAWRMDSFDVEVMDNGMAYAFDRIPPSAPTGLAATVIDSGTIDLTWEASVE